MLDNTVRGFLQNPLIARMTTIGPDGYPHSVPVWFVLDGDDIAICSVRDTRKVKHIQKNIKGAVTIGGELGNGGGYLLKGDYSIHEDADHSWINAMCRRYEDAAQAEKDIAAWADLDMIVIRLKPKVILKV